MVFFMVYTTHYHMVDLGDGANHVRRDRPGWPPRPFDGAATVSKKFSGSDHHGITVSSIYVYINMCIYMYIYIII